MNKSKYKRWQWWFCFISLSPLIVLVFIISFIGSALCFIGETLSSIEYATPPKILVKYVKWANGE